MHRIHFNFYNVIVLIQSADESILNLLLKDFSFFECQSKLVADDLQLNISLCPPPFEKIPNIVASMQTNNSLCYDTEEFRFCDYYGEALVIDSLNDNRGELFGTNTDKIHEIAYLYILSKVGKILDIRGLHKVHAFAVAYQNTAIVCMMPMKGGKSTLLLEFLKDSDFKMISDDIPLINTWGEVLPFPIKIGMNHPFVVSGMSEDSEFSYKMNRGVYGVKYLLSLKAIPEKIVSPDAKYQKIILVSAVRKRGAVTTLLNASKIKMMGSLMKHGVIGFGLPMVIEFFWQFGINDFTLKTYIFVRRFIAFLCLCLRSQSYLLQLGTEPSDAFLKISKLVKK